MVCCMNLDIAERCLFCEIEEQQKLKNNNKLHFIFKFKCVKIPK